MKTDIFDLYQQNYKPSQIVKPQSLPKDKSYFPPPRVISETEKVHRGKQIVHVGMYGKESIESGDGKILFTDGVYNCKAIVLIYICKNGKIGASLEHSAPNQRPSIHIPEGAVLIQKEWIDGPATNLRDQSKNFDNFNHYFSADEIKALEALKLQLVFEYEEGYYTAGIGCVGVTVDLDSRKIIIRYSKVT